MICRFFVCSLCFRNIYKPIDYLQVFRCATKGFPYCSSSDKARKDIRCQSCRNQAGVGVWTQLQLRLSQNWGFASATSKPAEGKVIPSYPQSPGGCLGLSHKMLKAEKSTGSKQGNRTETWSHTDGSIQHSHRSVRDLGQVTSPFRASFSNYLSSVSLI